jgi:hypothetical protein
MGKGKQAQQQRELRAAVWDELQMRYTCRDALQEQKQKCLEGNVIFTRVVPP